MSSDARQVAQEMVERLRTLQAAAAASARVQGDAAAVQARQYAGAAGVVSAASAAGAAGVNAGSASVGAAASASPAAGAAAAAAMDISAAGGTEAKPSREKNEKMDLSLAHVDPRRIGEWVDSNLGKWAYEKPSGKIRHIGYARPANDDALGMLVWAGNEIWITIATDTEETQRKLATLLLDVGLITGWTGNFPKPTKEHPHALLVSIWSLQIREVLPKLLSIVDKVEPIPLPIRERLWAAECRDDFLEATRLTIEHWLKQRTEKGFAKGAFRYDTAFDTAMRLAENSGCLDMYHLIADTCNAANLGKETIRACKAAFKWLKLGFQFVNQDLQQVMRFLYASNMLLHKLNKKGEPLDDLSKPDHLEEHFQGSDLVGMREMFKDIAIDQYNQWRRGLYDHYTRANSADLLSTPAAIRYIESADPKSAEPAKGAAAAAGAAARV